MMAAILCWSDMLRNLPISPIVLILVLVFSGVLLLGLEFFVIPGFGAGGILGALALLGAAFVAAAVYGFMWGVSVFLVSAILSVAGLLFGMKTKIIQKRLVLSAVQKHGQGTAAGNLVSLKGKQGIGITPLRPAGTARFDEQRVDVVSEGGFIDSGRTVVVTLVEGSRVVVKEVKE